MKQRTMCIFYDQVWAGVVLGLGGSFEIVDNPEVADGILVLYGCNTKQYEVVRDALRVARGDAVVITRPHPHLGLAFRTDCRLQFLTYKAWDVASVGAVCNDASIAAFTTRQPIVHVASVETGGWDVFDEFFQALAVFRRVVGHVAFRTVRVDAVWEPWGGLLTTTGDPGTPTGTTLVTGGPNVPFTSRQEIWGPRGILAQMDSPSTTACERWGASIQYAISALMDGDTGVRQRARDEVEEVLSKFERSNRR